MPKIEKNIPLPNDNLGKSKGGKKPTRKNILSIKEIAASMDYGDSVVMNTFNANSLSNYLRQSKNIKPISRGLRLPNSHRTVTYHDDYPGMLRPTRVWKTFRQENKMKDNQ